MAAALAVALLGGGWLLLGDSSLVSSTNARAGARLPVAVLSCGEPRAVTAQGVVLGSRLASAALPLAACSGEPRPGGRVRDGRVLAYLAVMGAAPGALARQVQRIYSGPYGVTARMRGGLLVYFGGSTRPHAKWASLATVLGDPGAAGAAYIDVRLPERPAAGAGQSGLLASSTSTTGGSTGGSTGASAGSIQSQVSASDPASAALAASLEQAVGGGNAANPPATASPVASQGASAPAASPTAATGASSEPPGDANAPGAGAEPQPSGVGAPTAPAPSPPAETGG